MTLVAPLLLLIAAVAQDSEADRLKKEVEKLKADQTVLLRQLEVAQAQLKDLTESLDKNKYEKAKAQDEANRAALELLSARSKKAVEEKFRALEELAVASAARLQGKVTAVAGEIGLVVISVGSESGVREGQEFSITRGGEAVGRLIVDRAELKWSAGKVIDRKMEPRIGDEVDRRMSVSPVVTPLPVPGATTSPRWKTEYSYTEPKVFPAPGTPKAGDELKALRKELDEVRSQVRMLSDRVIPAWQDEGLAMEELSGALQSQLRIKQGMVIRQVREGSPAGRMGFKPFDVVPDLGEVQILKAMKEGGKIIVYRQGTLETLQGSSPR